MTILKKIRIALFGLNIRERIELIKELRKVDESIREKYRLMDEIRNTPVPKCDGSL